LIKMEIIELVLIRNVKTHFNWCIKVCLYTMCYGYLSECIDYVTRHVQYKMVYFLILTIFRGKLNVFLLNQIFSFNERLKIGSPILYNMLKDFC